MFQLRYRLCDWLLRGNTTEDAQKRRDQALLSQTAAERPPRHRFHYNKHRQRVWCELGSGREVVDAQLLIGQNQLPIFRSVSLPGLCSAVLWNERQDVWLLSRSTSHHGNSLGARSLALRLTLLCLLLVDFSLDSHGSFAPFFPGFRLLM